MGPTAVGKTALAIKLAGRYPFDVISVDAAQVYRGMDIGTSKPDAGTLELVPHRLIDVCDPQERYSAGRFRQDALREINRTIGQGRTPLLVGGSMFYFKALAEGLSELPPASSAVSAEIEQLARSRGWTYLYEELKRIDPAAASQISPQDTQRIHRLLAIYRIQGRKPSEVMRGNRPQPIPFDIYRIALCTPNRDILKTRIEQRFQDMLECGFLDEAQHLYSSPGFDLSLPAMRTVGYRQAWDYLSGEISRQGMIDNAVRATCALAKRQLTWIRNTRDVIWVSSGRTDTSDLICEMLDTSLFS